MGVWFEYKNLSRGSLISITFRSMKRRKTNVHSSTFEEKCSVGANSFKNRSLFGRATMFRKANRKSQNLFPFAVLVVNP